MRRLAQARGFTIVETMIVLAVTAAMFIVAITAFSGQQERTRFSQATRDFTSKVSDVANDVSAGYFADTDEWTCTQRPTNSPLIEQGAAPSGQGKNQDCIFLGKALQFGPNDTSCAARCTKMRIATVVGHRTTTTAAGTRDVETLAEARPGAAPTGSPYDEEYALPYGLGVYKILDDSDQPIGGIAFITSLGASDSSNNPISGSQTVSLYRVSGVLGRPTATFDTNVRALRETARISKATICLRMGGVSGREAALVLTEQATGINTNLIIDNVPAGCT